MNIQTVDIPADAADQSFNCYISRQHVGVEVTDAGITISDLTNFGKGGDHPSCVWFGRESLSVVPRDLVPCPGWGSRRPARWHMCPPRRYTTDPQHPSFASADKSNDKKPWPTLANSASLSHSDSILLPLPVACPPRALLTTDIAADVDRITTHDLGRRVGGDASFKLLDKGYCGVPVRPVLDRIAVGDRTNVLTLALRDACNEADRAKMRPELAVAMDFDKATEAVNCIHRRDPIRATGTIIEPSLASRVSWRPSLNLRRPLGQLMDA